MNRNVGFDVSKKAFGHDYNAWCEDRKSNSVTEIIFKSLCNAVTICSPFGVGKVGKRDRTCIV